jgi:hypothetical protein
MTIEEMRKAVRKYALEHYEEGGWDYIVECYDDKDLDELLKNCTSVEDAIRLARTAVGYIHEQRREAWAEGGLCIKCGTISCEHQTG